MRRGMRRAPGLPRTLGARLLLQHKLAVRVGSIQQMPTEVHSIQSQTLNTIAHGPVLVLSIGRLRVGRPRLFKLLTHQLVNVDI